MKRLLGIAAGVVLAASTTAMAFAVTDYAGTVNGQPSSFVGFDVNRNANGKRVATNINLGRVDYTCDGAPDGSSGGYSTQKRFRIRNGRWHGKQNITEGGFDPVLTLTGKQVSRGEERGTLRLKGTLDRTHPDAKCDTGTVHWTATKNAVKRG